MLVRNPGSLPLAAEQAALREQVCRRIWGDHVHHGLWLSGDEHPELASVQLALYVAEAAGISRGATVCELDCGYGGVTRLLAYQLGARVTALATSRSQLQFLLGSQPQSLNPLYLQRDWQANQFADAAFDALLAIECPGQLRDAQRAFAEMQRVLRPSGRVVLCTLLADDQQRNWRLRLLRRLLRGMQVVPARSEAHYRELFAASGLELLGFEDLSQRVRRTWSISMRRALQGLPAWRAQLRLLFGHAHDPHCSAAKMLLIRLAYTGNALRYGLFVAQRR